MDVILPAAGLAERMRGLPKFLLPCDTSYLSLIEKHLENVKEYANNIWIPTRPDLIQLLSSMNLNKLGVNIFPVVTQTMNQTVLKVIEISSSDVFQVIMPDTFFSDKDSYQALSGSPQLVEIAIWNIQEFQKGKLGQVNIDDFKVIDVQDKNPTCNYKYFWGMMNFSREFVPYLHEDEPHIGYGLKRSLESGLEIKYKIINGKYYDCGTPGEYHQLINDIYK